MAIEKTISLNVEQKGVQEVEKSFDEISKKLKEVKKSAKDGLSGEGFEKIAQGAKKTEQAAKSVKVRLRELQDRMSDIGDVGSPEFQKLAKEAGALRDQMNNARAAIDSMSSDFPKLEVGMQAFNAIGGGVQAATGAMGAFGVESEAVQESMQKMMAIQSILNGVQSVSNALSDETALGLKLRTLLTNAQAKAQARAAASTTGLTVAQKALNLVMSLNPIGLVIGAVAALAAGIYFLIEPVKDLLRYFGLLSEETESASESYAKLTKEVERNQKAMDKAHAKRTKQLQRERELMEAQGATSEELHNQTLKQLKEEEDQRQEKLSAVKSNLDKQKALYKKALAEEDYETAKAVKEEIHKQREKYEQLVVLNGDYNHNVKLENLRFQAEQDQARQEEIDREKAAYEERLSKYKEFLQNRLDARRRIEDLEIANLEDENKRKLEAQRVQYERELQDLKDNTKIQQDRKSRDREATHYSI